MSDVAVALILVIFDLIAVEATRYNDEYQSIISQNLINN